MKQVTITLPLQVVTLWGESVAVMEHAEGITLYVGQVMITVPHSAVFLITPVGD